LSRTARLAFAIAAVVATGGCASFQDPTTIIDLRVIAVRTEPSEIILNVDLSNPSAPVLDPTSNRPVTVTPLIVDPSGDVQSGTYTITACPNNPFGAAPPTANGQMAGLPSGDARTTVGSQLCDGYNGPKWLLTPDAIPIGVPASIELTADQLLAAFKADVFVDQYGTPHGGFDLGMPLTLQIDVDTGAAQTKAVKRVLYWAHQIDPQQVANVTPVSAGLMTYPDRDANADPTITPVSIDEGTPFPIPAGSKPWIEPKAAQAESYQTTILSDTTHTVIPYTVDQETIRYAFYATAGTFTPFKTASQLPPGFTPTGDPNHPIHLESQYAAPATVDGLPVDPATGGGLVTIWVIVRDDRGGESWLERQLAIQP
jgi:hypothetical protein